MIGVRKPFNASLHAKNDPKSRTLVKAFFAERGVKIDDHPNKYDIDLISDDGTIRVEVEHRLNWNVPVFPYEEINVPERKAKFFSEGTTHYIILSKDYKYIGFISASKIRKFIKPEFLKESKNRFVAEREYFYKIPRTEFEFYQIET
jgi:hypothetical protein